MNEMTTNTNNRGIMHLVYQFGGTPFCGTRRAIMATIPAEAHKWPRLCSRCEVKLRKMQTKGGARS